MSRDSKPYQIIADLLLLGSLLTFLAVYFDIRHLFSDTIVTGGDTASWYGVAHHMLKVLLPNGRLTGWDMGNFCGYPNFHFYFIPPFLLAVLPSYFFGLPLTITLKCAIMSGIFLLPVTTYFGLRAMAYRFPVPIIGASASFLLLFNESYTMFGANTLSTFAGEFCYMFAFSLLPWFMGSLYRGLETRKGAAVNGIVLGLIGLSHLFVFIPAVFLVIYGYFSRGQVRYLWKVSWIGFGVMAFWILPVLVYRHPYTTPFSMTWQDFVSWRYTLTGLAFILFMVGPRIVLSSLRAQKLPAVPVLQKNGNNNPPLKLIKPDVILIFFACLLTFVFFYLLGQYLVLGKDLWYAGLRIPDLSLSPLGEELAYSVRSWIVPASLIFSISVMGIGMWARKGHERFEIFSKTFGFLCFMAVLGVALVGLYRIIGRSIDNEGVRSFFLEKSTMVFICSFFILAAGWLFFFSNGGKTAIQRLTSTSGPRTFGMFLSLIFGCIVMYFSAHFLKMPDIRFLPPALFALILLFFADTLGSYISSCTPATRVFGAVAVWYLCILTVIFSASKSDVWFRCNNMGYESTPGYREFIQVNDYLKNCEKEKNPLNEPRVGYEKCDLYGIYGGDRVFESLPFFSGRQTMEGIHFASSLASRCIVFLQTEYSRDIKTPKSRILSRINPEALPAHLDLYNISQLILRTGKAKKAIADSSLFEKEASFGGLSIYRYLGCDEKYVDVPKIRPVIYTSKDWAEDFYKWYKRPDEIDVLLVPEKFVTHEQDRACFFHETEAVSSLRPFQKETLDRTGLHIVAHLEHLKIRFTTNKVGLPHLIKVSYFPNWRVEGAHGVYPVSPHLMMVIPRQQEVVLTYGRTFWENLGGAITGVTLAALLIVWIFSLRKGNNSFFSKPPPLIHRIHSQKLFLPIEEALSHLRPLLLILVFMMAFALIVMGAVKRNLPVRTYVEGYRSYEIATRMSLKNRADSAQEYYKKAIHRMEPFLDQREKFDQIDVILCILLTGMCYENLGQRDTAEVWYQTVVSEYPYGRYVGEAYVKIARIRKHGRNQILEDGLRKLREGESASGLSLLRTALLKTREGLHYFNAAIKNDPYSVWAERALKEMKEEKSYFEANKHRIISATTEKDILEFFSLLINKDIVP